MVCGGSAGCAARSPFAARAADAPIVSPLCRHTAVFAAYRGSLEQAPGRTNTGILAGVQPLLVVALPSVAYGAYYRAIPPQALRFGVISAALLHLYDRCWHPKGLTVDNMPTARLARRVW